MNRLLLLCASAVASTAAADAVREDRPIMHTVVTVQIADPPADEKQLAAAFDDAYAVFADIDETMNEWKSDSPLGRINSGSGTPVKAPANLCSVIRLALDGARRTHGLFDPTWAALRDVWRFSDTEPGVVPQADVVKKQCALVGYQQVKVKNLPRGECEVTLKPGMKLGLSGLVKGWGVDQAAARLRKRGLKNFFIQAGGDLYFAGQNGERPWRSGIRQPRGAPSESFAKLQVTDRAFSTSGDYEHFFIADGKRYHHIIDLRTCWPASASRSVTVLTPKATDAEFLTKAAFVLGPVEGLKLVESLGGAAVIVDSDNRVHVSKSLESKLELTPPHD